MTLLMQRLILFLIAVHQICATCSNALFEYRGSAVYPNCPDQQTPAVYRTGYSDLRWPSQQQNASGYPVMPSHTSPYVYSYPQSSTGYGNGFSYGYNDVRRSGPGLGYYTHPYASGYGSYQRESYASSPAHNPYKYGQPYHQAMHGSQYYPTTSQYYPSSTQFYDSHPTANMRWSASSVVNGYPYPSGYNQFANVVQYSSAPRTGPQSLTDPQLGQQQNYMFPFGRQAFPKEGQAVMKGHPSAAVGGIIEFCQVGPTSVRVKGQVNGLPGQPGNRGLHILKDSDCPPLDQIPIDSKALEHFNPFNARGHGSRDSFQRHAGDLGNIFRKFDGVASIDFTVSNLFLDDSFYSIANHSIVITEREDDLGLNQSVESLLRGNAGRAIACGVIRVKASPPPPPSSFMPSSTFLEDPFSRRQDYYASFPSQNYPFAQ